MASQTVSALQTQEEVVEDIWQTRTNGFCSAGQQLISVRDSDNVGLWGTRRAGPRPQVFRSSGEGKVRQPHRRAAWRDSARPEGPVRHSLFVVKNGSDHLSGLRASPRDLLGGHLPAESGVVRVVGGTQNSAFEEGLGPIRCVVDALEYER